LSAAKRIAYIAAGIAVTTFVSLGCSWDYPVWPKDKKSDIPLFRFVINEREGAGYIDRDGRIIIQPTLSHFGNNSRDDFFDGLAKVHVNGQGWYIDRTGKPVIRTHYFGSGHFSEGLASNSKGGKTGFIDREGKLVVPRLFDYADDFAEGLAVVEVNRRFGYINKEGSFAIQPKYALAMAFSDGAARVIEKGQCVRWDYGPCSGITTLPYDPDVKPSIHLPRCHYSFIDRQGMRLFEQKYPDAKDFAEGLAPVGDGKLWGYVDKNGAVVIPLIYEDAEPFAEGLARVRSAGKWGYINKMGKLVIPAVYQHALDFSEGMAVVSDGVFKYWFIDKNGDQAIAKFYTGATSFVMGRAHVRNGVDYYTAKWSYIDRDGRAVFTYSDQSNRAQGDAPHSATK
jgi:hypothetical protein